MIAQNKLGTLILFHFISRIYFISALLFQCFDAVGWAAGRASGL